MQAFYDQKVVWGGCDSFVTDTSRIPTARCAKVKVPVNYDKLMGAVAELAVLRVPATGKRVGALLVNPGGPGGSGVDLAAGMGAKLGDSAIGQSFDIVGFDPRGVGGSTPTLRCRTDAEFDAFRMSRWPTTARPGWPTSRTCTANTSTNARTGWGSTSWPTPELLRQQEIWISSGAS